MSPELTPYVLQRATSLGLMVLGALVIWIVGRIAIKLVVSAAQTALARQHVDATLMRYLGNILSVALNIALAVGILGYFGVERRLSRRSSRPSGWRSAWRGAACSRTSPRAAFLIVLRPFKAGDAVSAGGVTGTVREVGLFVTSIDTPDNVLTLRRQRQDLRRYRPELHRQPVPARGPRRAAEPTVSIRGRPSRC